MDAGHPALRQTAVDGDRGGQAGLLGRGVSETTVRLLELALDQRDLMPLLEQAVAQARRFHAEGRPGL